jgi:hypothetical protein
VVSNSFFQTPGILFFGKILFSYKEITGLTALFPIFPERYFTHLRLSNQNIFTVIKWCCYITVDSSTPAP